MLYLTCGSQETQALSQKHTGRLSGGFARLKSQGCPTYEQSCGRHFRFAALHGGARHDKVEELHRRDALSKRVHLPDCRVQSA